MPIKFFTRAQILVLMCVVSSGWSAISAQAQSSQNDENGAKTPVAYALDKSAPSEIASTSPTATGTSATPDPATASSPEPTAAAPDPAPAGAAPVPDTKSRPEMTPQSGPKDKPEDSYIVGIADELQISVWKEPDLSGPVVVRPDGMITLPVVDDVAVVGMTTKQVQDILTEKLKPVVDQPQVTVIVRNIRSRKVYLVGQVGHPGSVALNGHETVLQILAESGGPSLYAKSDKIYILRQNGGRQERLNFNYKKALKGTDPRADFPLESGDVIVVP